MSSFSSIATFPKVKQFSELANVDISMISDFDDVAIYVSALNRGNPLFVGPDLDVYFEKKKELPVGYKLCDTKACCVCSNFFFSKINSPFRTLWARYKPHKSNWCDHFLCEACHWLLQNPQFKQKWDSFHYSGIDGYEPSEIVKFKDSEGLYLKDLRNHRCECEMCDYGGCDFIRNPED
jgi:hypothetical protein